MISEKIVDHGKTPAKAVGKKISESAPSPHSVDTVESLYYDSVERGIG